MSQTSTHSAARKLPSRVYARHGAYYFVEPGTGKWVHLGKTEQEAIQAHQKLIAAAPVRGTMGALFDRYMREVAPQKAPRSYEDNLRQIEYLKAVFGRMKPAAVRPKHVAQYLDERGKTAPVQANREKALLSHVFTMAMRWGDVDMNPCRGVHRNPEKPRKRYITHDEFDAVASLANQLVRDAMVVAYATAQRIGDVLEMGVNDIVKVEDGQWAIRVVQNKTGARLEIAIDPNDDRLMEVVLRRSEGRKGGWLFEHLSGGEPSCYTYDGFSAMFKRTVKKALRLGRIASGFTFHDIRAKAVTDAMQKGMDAQSLAGHRTESQTAAYVRGTGYTRVTSLAR